MQEIKCPNCGKVFQVDESEYAQIVRQVRDKEFKDEILNREKELADRKEKDLKMAQMEQEKVFKETIGEKDKVIEQLRAQISGSETEKS